MSISGLTNPKRLNVPVIVIDLLACNVSISTKKIAYPV